jgi:hypothetical protein
MAGIHSKLKELYDMKEHRERKAMEADRRKKFNRQDERSEGMNFAI